MTITMGIGNNFGDLLTEAMRKCAWFNENYESAVRKMEREFPELSNEQIDNILKGKSKFQTCKDGINITIVEDFWIFPDWKEITNEIFKMKEGNFTKYNLYSYQTKHLQIEAEEIYDLIFENKEYAYEKYIDFINIVKTIGSKNKGLFSKKFDIIDEDIELISSKSFDVNNGWLSPLGIFYACKHYQHSILADKINTELIINSEGINGEKEIENLGYIKLADGNWECRNTKGIYNVQSAQINYIENWQKSNNKNTYVWNGISLTYEKWLHEIMKE